MLGGKASVHTENFLVDNGGDGQTVKAVCESLPKLDIVSALAFVIEAIDTVDGCTLVVAPKQKKSFRDTLFYTPTANKWSPKTAFLGLHNLRETSNWHQGGTHRTQIAAKDRSTVHEYHQQF